MLRASLVFCLALGLAGRLSAAACATSVSFTSAAGYADLSGEIYFQPLDMPEAGFPGAIRIYVYDAGQARAAIYPSRLSGTTPVIDWSYILGESPSLALNIGWNNLTLTSQPFLQAGRYWMALQVSTGVRVLADSTSISYRPFPYGPFPYGPGIHGQVCCYNTRPSFAVDYTPYAPQCQQTFTVSPTPSETRTRTPTRSPSSTVTPTVTGTGSPAPSVTASLSPSSTPTASPSASPTASASSTPTASPSPSPTLSPSGSASPTVTLSATVTVTPTQSLTWTASPSPTVAELDTGLLPTVKELTAIPNPTPRELRVHLWTKAARLELKLYSKNLVLVDTVQYGPHPKGWSSLTLPPGWQGLANGAYFVSLYAWSAAGERGPQKTAKFVQLR